MSREIRLSPVVEGVEFMLNQPELQARVVVLRDAFESLFGATDSPQSWLDAFKANEHTIEHAALSLARASRLQRIIVLSTDVLRQSLATRRKPAQPLSTPA